MRQEDLNPAIVRGEYRSPDSYRDDLFHAMEASRWLSGPVELIPQLDLSMRQEDLNPAIVRGEYRSRTDDLFHAMEAL